MAYDAHATVPHRATPLVLHVVPMARGGGAEATVATLVERLPDHGVAAQAVYFLGADELQASGTAVSFDRPSQRDPRLIGDLRRLLTRAVRERDTVIVHTHLGWPLYYARLAARGLPICHVHTEHSTGNVRRRPSLRWIERRAYGGLAQVFAVSTGAAHALRTWLGSSNVPIDVVMNGARQFAAARRDAPDGSCRLVSVGSLTRHKGFDVALDAIAGARDVVAEYRIVGDGPEREALRAHAERLGLADVVRFVGWSDDVGAHLHWAHAALIPSRREGFGLAAIEALSAGLPVVATRIPGLEEVVCGAGAAALLADVDDAAAFAAAIRTIATSSADAYAALRDPAMHHAARFSIDAMVQEYARHYRVLAARGSASTRGERV